MTTVTASALPQVSARRRWTDKVMRGLLVGATLLALVPLILIVYFLLKRGLSAWTSGGFFTSDPTGSFFGVGLGSRGELPPILGFLQHDSMGPPRPVAQRAKAVSYPRQAVPALTMITAHAPRHLTDCRVGRR